MRGNEDENGINVQAKSLLYLFIEYVWDERYGQMSTCEDVEFTNWLSSLDLNVNDEAWFSSNELDVRIASRMQSTDQQMIEDLNDKRFYAKIADNLRQLLPFLMNCHNNIKYTDEDG